MFQRYCHQNECSKHALCQIWHISSSQVHQWRRSSCTWGWDTNPPLCLMCPYWLFRWSHSEIYQCDYILYGVHCLYAKNPMQHKTYFLHTWATPNCPRINPLGNIMPQQVPRFHHSSLSLTHHWSLLGTRCVSLGCVCCLPSCWLIWANGHWHSNTQTDVQKTLIQVLLHHCIMNWKSTGVARNLIAKQIIGRRHKCLTNSTFYNLSIDGKPWGNHTTSNYLIWQNYYHTHQYALY